MTTKNQAVAVTEIYTWINANHARIQRNKFLSSELAARDADIAKLLIEMENVSNMFEEPCASDVDTPRLASLMLRLEDLGERRAEILHLMTEDL